MSREKYCTCDWYLTKRNMFVEGSTLKDSEMNCAIFSVSLKRIEGMDI